MAEEKNISKPTVKPVAQGKVKQKGLGEKAAEAFFSEDTKTVGNYIIWDVIIPGLKNAVMDVIEMALFGSSNRSSRRRGSSHVSYQSYYDSDSRSRSSRGVERNDRTSRYDFSDIILDTRGDAEQVMASMEELINKYGEATVADLCSLVGLSSKFTDQKWGWTDCRDLSYRRSGRGYILDFATPDYLG